MNLVNWGTATTQVADSSLSPKLLILGPWAVTLSVPRLEKAQSRHTLSWMHLRTLPS